MLPRATPEEAYRRVDFDARVAGASPGELVTLCYERIVTALSSALFAHERADNRRKSLALTRALAAITALQLGVGGDHAIVSALHRFYEGQRRSVLDNVLVFDPLAIEQVRSDFAEISSAMAAASSVG